MKADHLAGLLRYYRSLRGLSRNRMALRAHVDPSFVTRIEHSERMPAHRPIVVALADALELAGYDRDRLLVAAGFSPQCVADLGTWPRAADELVHAITELSEDERIELMYVVHQIVDRFVRVGATRG